ncbi:hypothetical protein Sjap_007464 [Stephania japonica]|uniref:Uncharacterized protein n=1 Tax=Stephania japonica TaxID=461633 RepID=A0AAP0PDR1_9MAGN
MKSADYCRNISSLFLFLVSASLNSIYYFDIPSKLVYSHLEGPITEMEAYCA